MQTEWVVEREALLARTSEKGERLEAKIPVLANN
jgi:hypothetical protein